MKSVPAMKVYYFYVRDKANERTCHLIQGRPLRWIDAFFEGPMSTRSCVARVRKLLRNHTE